MKFTTKRRTLVQVLLVGGGLFLLSGLAMAQNDDVEGLSRDRAKSATKNAANSSEVRLLHGVLSRAAYGQWQLGDQPLVLTDNSRVSSREDPMGLTTELEEGKEALVMGSLRPRGLVVRRVIVLGSDESVDRGRMSRRRIATEPQAADHNDPR